MSIKSCLRAAEKLPSATAGDCAARSQLRRFRPADSLRPGASWRDSDSVRGCWGCHGLAGERSIAPTCDPSREPWRRCPSQKKPRASRSNSGASWQEKRALKRPFNPYRYTEAAAGSIRWLSLCEVRFRSGVCVSRRRARPPALRCGAAAVPHAWECAASIRRPSGLPPPCRNPVHHSV